MTLYVAIDIMVAAGPLLLSFDRKVSFVRRWPAALAASIIVGGVFATWDSFMTRAGAWGFAERYAGPPVLAGLPLGEIFFFVAIPFACLFVYEVISAYVPERVGRTIRAPWIAASVLLAAASALLYPRLYTTAVLLAAALVLLVASVLAPRFLASRRFWISIGVTYLPFLAANGALTALPVVTYSPQAILGVRALTIPVEDFLYSFALLGSCFLVFGALREPLRLGSLIRRPRQETRRTTNVSTTERAKTPAKNARWTGNRSAE